MNAGILGAALAIFAIVLALFGGFSYGLYYYGATWGGFAFFGALVVGLFALV